MKWLYISIPLDRMEDRDRLRPFLEELGRWAFEHGRISSTYYRTYAYRTDRLEDLWAVVRERGPAGLARAAWISWREEGVAVNSRRCITTTDRLPA